MLFVSRLRSANGLWGRLARIQLTHCNYSKTLISISPPDKARTAPAEQYGGITITREEANSSRFLFAGLVIRTFVAGRRVNFG